MIHGLLAAALAVNLALPVTAAGTSSFTDVSDSNTALNADILRLMGVVSGTGGNQFNPNQVLTRAQFCTMQSILWAWGTRSSSTPPAPFSPM